MASPTFDYIIVGGGVAGCALASRLSEALPKDSILLIEAGPEHDARIAPSMGVALSDTTDIQWNHRSVPQKALDGGTVSQTQGKVLGGCAAINYQAWTRGAAPDFDRWASEVGDKRWSWEGLLPYFKKTETFIPPKSGSQENRPDIHGYDGPITVSHVSSSAGGPRNYPLKSMMQDIYDKAGMPFNPDLNSGSPFGYGEYPNNTFNGERKWAATSYKRGPNVTLWDNTQVSKLLFSRKKVTAIEVLPNNHNGTRALVKKEVLVTAGVQNSAKLLLLSGIGPNAELEKHKIPQLVDLPVGENFSDHPFIATFWKVRDRNLALGDMEMISPEVDWTAGVGCDFLSFHRHDDEKTTALAKKTLDGKAIERFQLPGRPHTETLTMHGHIDLTGLLQPPVDSSVFTFFNILVAPSSRGSVQLSSASPEDPPLIDPAIFEHPVDLQLVYDLTRRTSTAIQKSSAVSKYGAVEYAIDEDIRNDLSDEALRKRLLNTVETVFHGSGTCAMGAVVDTECRVKGVDGLRVIDASVFPFPIAAHYQAIVYAVAEQEDVRYYCEDFVSDE
ncbi:related to alcohol oxidase [Phialocephala subalpina]|uniref:Related to alcohol oxidase n=1 Tax=Phialocephala subalpina TaxID=576137 RepID=A0A1L7XE64_9HELO|nr:related to alcohol oxidase [Phialocephala subalpina]